VAGKAVGDKKQQAEGKNGQSKVMPYTKLRATLRMAFEKPQRQQTKTEPTMLVNFQTLAAAVVAFYWLPNSEVHSTPDWLATRACASVLSRPFFLTGLRNVGDSAIR
jgi:hypothetical protein